MQASFDRWVAGTGSPFDLLEPTASWNIVGSSPLSRTYDSRQQFMDEVIKPFNARMKARLIPTVRGVYADGDTVVIFFDANATAKDGKPYHNTYTWYFQMRQLRVVNAISLFDTREFDEFWNRAGLRLDFWTLRGYPRKISFGGNLYLLVMPKGGRYWRCYRYSGKRKTLALRIYPEVPIARARSRHQAARQLLATGVDPSLKKKELRRVGRLQLAT